MTFPHFLKKICGACSCKTHQGDARMLLRLIWFVCVWVFCMVAWWFLKADFRLCVSFHLYFYVVVCIDMQLHMLTASRQCPRACWWCSSP